MSKRAKKRKPSVRRDNSGGHSRRRESQPQDAGVAQVNSLIPRAVAHLNKGDLTEAMRLIKAGMRAAPQHPEFPHLAAQILLSLPQGDKAEARRLLKKTVELAPKVAQYHLTLSGALLLSSEMESALRHARLALRLEPANALAHTGVGVALAQLKRHKEAVEAFSNATRLEPDNPEAWLNLAMCQMELREADEVERSVQRLTSLVGEPPPAMLYKLGNIFRGLGQLGAAAQSYRKAIERNPESGRVWFALADVQSLAVDLDAATQALREAERCGYSRCAIRYTEGRILGMQQQVQQAKSKLEQAATLAGDDVGKLGDIAAELARLGDFQAQQACLERMLEIDPESVRAFAALQTMPGRSLGEEQLERLKQLEGDTGVDVAARKTIGFALGNHYRYANDLEESFRFYKRGNRLSGYLFNESAYREWQVRIESAFTKVLFERRTGAGNPSNLPALIVGMPRSGTTLTEQIVSSHPSIHGAGEYGMVAAVAGVSDLPTTTFEAPIDRLIDASDELLGGYASNYLDTMTKLAGAGVAHVTNKMPHNFQQLGLFALLFPSAPIIHIKRDPLDNLLSIYFTDFQGAHAYAYDLKTLGRYYRLYERLMDHWASVLPNPMYQLQYEELVEDLPGKTAELADFLGVSLDERMLRFWEQDREVETASQWQVRQPVYTSSIGRWKPYEKHLKPLFDGLDS